MDNKPTYEELEQKVNELEDEVFKHKQVAGDLKLFKKLINQSNDCIFVTDPETSRFLDVNHKACINLGYTREELLSMVVGDIQVGLITQWDQYIKEVREKGNIIVEGMHRRKDGTTFPVEVSVKYISREKLDYFVARDITERKRTEEQLRKLYSAVEQSPETIMITDNHGNIEYVNPKFTLLTGYSFDEVLGKNPVFLKSGEQPPEFYKHLWETINSGNTWRGEFLNKKKNGEYYWEHASISPIFNNEDVITHFVAVKEDISERKRMEEALRESEERFRAVFEHAGNSILVLDGETGDILEFNDQAHENLGYTREEFSKFTLADIEVIESADEIRDHVRKILEEGTGLFETKHRTKQGDIRDIIVNVKSFKARGKNFIVSIFVDISVRKRAEKEFKIAKNEAEQASNAKTQFLSNMSHELRTPMNAILGFAQLLESDPADPLSASQTASVKQILKSGRHLLALIKDVLDLSRIETGGLDISMENVAVNALVEDTITLIMPIAESRNISLKNNIDKSNCHLAMADTTRLKQVLINLMSNAIKYNNEGGSVTISCDEISDKLLRLRVIDTGPGIPEEKQAELFEPFRRLGAETTEIEGTGIGLTIAKRLVEHMGGTIGVESSPDKGSCFYIDLIKAKNEVSKRNELAALKPTSTEFAAKEEILILYIEDNTASQLLVKSILKRRSNITLLCASMAEVGIEMANTHKPNLILLDINLPDIDGFEALKRLKACEKTRNIPVIAMSAYAMPNNVQQGLIAGFVRYIIKPIDIISFLEVIDSVLG